MIPPVKGLAPMERSSLIHEESSEIAASLAGRAYAQARHRHGLEDYRDGEGLGGRYVPPHVIRANADATWGSVNRGVFEDVKPQFDSWKLYDNSVDGRGPVLLESSDGSERDDDE